MKFSTTITAALFAATTLAAPTAESRLAKRIARRASSRRTNPVQWITPNAETDGANEPGKTDAEESTNWSGVVIQSPPSGTKFTAVSATFTVPKPTSTGGSSAQAASAWVGIDGDTCGSAILQTGVDFNVQGSSVSYDSWYEWYPDYAYDFSGISFSVGDQVALSVVASSSTSGTATIENLSTGQTVNQRITSSSALCQENAEWIVEDFEEGGGLVPFADFNKVTFTNAVAHTSNGGTVDAGTGTQIDIVQNGQQLTQVSDSGTTVTVQYT